MAYEGEIMQQVPANLDFTMVYAVIVSGDGPNPCGHALLFVPFQRNIAQSGGYYFQVAGVIRYPRGLSVEGYARYMRETGKTEITRYGIPLSNPSGAQARLAELLNKYWVWLVIPHNCAAFVEDIARGGGSSAGLWSNCPSRETFDRPFYERAYEEVDRQIRRLYMPF
ncbi:MAG: hypothetical protein ABI954_01885 [Pyrinomonadaceae bacterium]